MGNIKDSCSGAVEAITGGNTRSVPSQSSKRLRKDAKIVIVGAGTAGIHMASLLIKAGYKNVEILEKTNRFGGKVYTIYDKYNIPHELGAIYPLSVTNELFKEYDPKNPEIAITDGILTDRITKNSTELDPINVTDFILNETEFQFVDKNLHWIHDILTGGIEIMIAAKKYEKAYSSVFGGLDHLKNGMMLPPKPKNMKSIDMNFQAFLEKHDCLELIPMFMFTTMIQGYGGLDTLSAYYGLLWNRPDWIRSMLNVLNITRNNRQLVMMKNGMSSLWNKMVKKHKMNIRLNTQIISINRNINNYKKQTEIKLENGDIIYCDILFLAMNQKHAIKLLIDATDEEKRIFGNMKSYTLCTTLFESENEEISNFHEIAWPEEVIKGNGELYGLRQSIKVIKPELSGKLQSYLNVSYQFIDTAPNHDFGDEKEKENAINILRENMEEIGYNDINIHKQMYWEYFTKWQHCDIMKGYPWKVRDEMQGKNKCTFYIGGSVCFESVPNVIGYNQHLFNTINTEDMDHNSDSNVVMKLFTALCT